MERWPQPQGGLGVAGVPNCVFQCPALPGDSGSRESRPGTRTPGFGALLAAGLRKGCLFPLEDPGVYIEGKWRAGTSRMESPLAGSGCGR